MKDLKLFSENGIELGNVDIVAFDIFDTLVYRKVSPMHVHRMWANQLIDCFSLSYDAEQIVKMKFACGRIAKLRNVCVGKDREFQYRQMTDLLMKRLRIKIDPSEFYSTCLDLELKVEKSVCYVPEEIKQFVSQIQLQKQVICISDFYLPAVILKKILSLNGLEIDGIYVSSEFLLQKKTGRLYSSVIESLKVPANRIVMLGDNESSDVDNAVKAGFRAIHLENKKQHEFYSQFELDLCESRAEFHRFLSSPEVRDRQIPFSNVAFLMHIFITRLYKELKKDGCQHVLFMSREGEFFKKLFDAYQEHVIQESERIQTHYFYVSRRATIVPSIHNAEKNEFKEIYKNYPEMSIRDFLRNLGMDKNERVLQAINNIDIDCVIHDFSESTEYQTLLNTNEFKEECLKAAKEQRVLFQKYLDDMGINYRSQGLYLVDVGYSGTSQNNICKIYNGEVSIHGYYMISYAERKSITDINSKKGIVYDIASGQKKNVFTYNSAVIEMLSLASHCGVDSYTLGTHDKVLPVFHKNESELMCYKNVIAPLQESIINVFNKISVFVSKAYYDENSYFKAFQKQYKRFIYNPSIVEMEEYLTIPFVDNFAIYREYTPEDKSRRHGFISITGIKRIVSSKGSCLKEQNTHWIAAALYKLDMRCLNPILYIFSDFTMKMFDAMAAAARRRKGIKET